MASGSETRTVLACCARNGAAKTSNDAKGVTMLRRVVRWEVMMIGEERMSACGSYSWPRDSAADAQRAQKRSDVSRTGFFGGLRESGRDGVTHQRVAIERAHERSG